MNKTNALILRQVYKAFFCEKLQYTKDYIIFTEPQDRSHPGYLGVRQRRRLAPHLPERHAGGSVHSGGRHDRRAGPQPPHQQDQGHEVRHREKVGRVQSKKVCSCLRF